MTVISLLVYGNGRHETFVLSPDRIHGEYLRQLLRRPIENDNDPGFLPDHCWDARDDRKHGLRRSPTLDQRLKRFGRFQEILDTPQARLERSRWRDMPALTFVAPHARRCVCHRCLKHQQTTYKDDAGPDFAVPTYIETDAGWRTVPDQLEGDGNDPKVAVLGGQRFVLARRAETDSRTGHAATYDAWVPLGEQDG